MPLFWYKTLITNHRATHCRKQTDIGWNLATLRSQIISQWNPMGRTQGTPKTACFGYRVSIDIAPRWISSNDWSNFSEKECNSLTFYYFYLCTSVFPKIQTANVQRSRLVCTKGWIWTQQQSYFASLPSPYTVTFKATHKWMTSEVTRIQFTI